MSHENLQALNVLSEVALGLILFSVGSVFHHARFLRYGRRIFYLTVIESSGAALLVSIGAFFIGQPWQVAGTARCGRHRHGAGVDANGIARVQ